jgi:hypothetical protein
MGSKRGVGGGEGDKLGHQVHTRDMGSIRLMNQQHGWIIVSFISSGGLCTDRLSALLEN